MFDIFDTDGSGTVDEEELAGAMFALGLGGNAGGGGQREAARKLMDRADSDGSRTVDLGEFKALMQELAACRHRHNNHLLSFQAHARAFQAHSHSVKHDGLFLFYFKSFIINTRTRAPLLLLNPFSLSIPCMFS